MNRLGCLNPRLQTRQQQRDFGGRHCFAEKKSLYLHASFSAQNFKLFLGLDPLRGGDHAQLEPSRMTARIMAMQSLFLPSSRMKDRQF